jgi:hypothetical protein
MCAADDKVEQYIRSFGTQISAMQICEATIRDHRYLTSRSAIRRVRCLRFTTPSMLPIGYY